MIRAFVLFVAFQLCNCERKIECSNSNQTHFIDEGETIRFTSESYPESPFYWDPPGGGIAYSHCGENFTTADGYILKLSFIVGYLPSGVTIIFDDADGSSEVTFNVDTSKDASLQNWMQTFYTSQNLSFDIHESVPLEWFNMGWIGFEATVTSMVVNGSSSCKPNEVIDLSKAEGPVDFGTEWRNESEKAPSRCSWTITSPPNMVTKLAVKRINLRDGESVNVTSSKEERPIDAANDVMTFQNEAQITVTYERKGGDSDQYGILLHASAFEHREPSSDKCSYDFFDYDNEETVVMGGEDGKSTYTIFPHPDGIDHRLPYTNNQICKWLFEVSPNHELRIDVLHTIFESGGDHLIMTSPQAYELSPLSPPKHFLFANNSIDHLNLTWQTDGNVAMWGLYLEMEAIECTCRQIDVTQWSYAYSVICSSRNSICENMKCAAKYHAPHGFVILLGGGYVELPQEGDMFTIMDDGKVLHAYQGIQKRTSIMQTLATSGTLKIIQGRGNYSDDDYMNFKWALRIQAVPQSFSMKESVNLTETAPTSYRSTAEFQTWHVKATQNVRAFFPNKEPNRPNSLWDIMEIHDGDENAATIDISRALSDEGFLTSSGNELTFVMNMTFDEREWLRPSDDIFVYVEDSNNSTSCAADFSPLQLNRSLTPFELKGGADKSCYLTLMSDDSDTGSFDNYKIRLQNIEVHLGEDKEPVRVFAGSFQDPMPREQQLVAFKEDGDNDWKDGIVANQRIITIVAPMGSTISARATTAIPYVGVVHFSTRRQISSPLFPKPNYIEHWESEFNERLEGMAEIEFQFHSFDNDSSPEIEIGNETFTLVKDTAFSFVADSFKLTYNPAGNGEKGFLLDYYVGEEQTVTDSTTSLPQSSSIEPELSTERSHPPITEVHASTAVPYISTEKPPQTMGTYDPTAEPQLSTKEPVPSKEAHTSTVAPQTSTEKPLPSQESHASTAAPHFSTEKLPPTEQSQPSTAVPPTSTEKPPPTLETYNPTAEPQVSTEEPVPSKEPHTSAAVPHESTEKQPLPSHESQASTVEHHATTENPQSPATESPGRSTGIQTGTVELGTTTPKAEQAQPGSTVQLTPLRIIIAVCALLQLVVA